MGKRNLILIEPGAIATTVKLEEDNGIIRSEKDTRAYMAPSERITEYRIRKNEVIRTGELTMFHRDSDLPISLNAGPEMQTVEIADVSKQKGRKQDRNRDHEEEDSKPQTTIEMTKIELGPWASFEGTKIKRWEIAKAAFNSEAQAGEQITSGQLFGIMSSVGLLVAVVFLAVQLGLSYNATPTP